MWILYKCGFSMLFMLRSVRFVNLINNARFGKYHNLAINVREAEKAIKNWQFRESDNSDKTETNKTQHKLLHIWTQLTCLRNVTSCYGTEMSTPTKKTKQII